jgi:hypothetical protein
MAVTALFIDGMVSSQTDKDKGKEAKGLSVGFSVMFNSFVVQLSFNILAYVIEVVAS